MSKKGLNELKERMKKDGIKEQLLQEVDHFTACPMCCVTFSRKNLPDLLDCGHVSCSECSKEQFCVICSRNVKITSKSYTVLFDYFEVVHEATEEKSAYHFVILNLNSGNSRCFSSIASETTVSQLVMKSADFVQYLSHGKDSTGCNVCGIDLELRISNKSFLYQMIKNKTFAEMVMRNMIRLYPTSTNGLTNSITFQERYSGG